VLGKKFDIRQWVLVTSWQPLKIWYFDECYLRFTADNYDASKIHNKFMHLTNNCIASQSKNFGDSAIEGNMWTGEQFQRYLLENSADNTDVYVNKVQPQVKRGIVASVLAARDSVVQRDNAHEMFGYDFMVDTHFNVWLIEVNSSPSMEHSTQVTQRLVNSVLTQVGKMIVECENGTGLKNVGDKCGKFELIYSEQ